MMNDKHFETLMQQGRQKTDAAFHRAVEDALSKTHGRRRRMKASSLAAAVLAAALGLSAVAAAAVTICGSVFASMKAENEKQAGIPEEQMIEEFTRLTAGYRGAVIEKSAQAGEITVTLKTLVADGETVRLEVIYSPAAEGMDPAMDDLTLTADGKKLALAGDNEDYRKTKKEVYSTATFSGGNSVSCTYTYALDGIKLQAGSRLSFGGELHTYDAEHRALSTLGEFRIETALEQEMFERYDGAEQEAYLKGQQAYHQQRAQQLEALSANAAFIGLEEEGAFGKAILSELSVLPETSEMYLGAILPGKVLSKQEGLAYTLSLRIDGMEMGANRSWENGKTEDGETTILLKQPLSLDLSSLPEESLLWAALERDDPEGRQSVEFVFRYNWKAKKAILPEDAQQRQAWLAEEKAMRPEKQPAKRIPADPEAVMQIGDVTVRMEEMVLENNTLRVELSADPLVSCEQLVRMAQVEEDADITINGLPVQHYNGFSQGGQEGVSGKKYAGFLCVLPVNEAQLPEQFEVTIEKTLYEADSQGIWQEIGRISLKTTADLKKAQVMEPVETDIK